MASQKASKGLPGSASNKNRQAYFLRYASEDRAWWSKARRLVALVIRAKSNGKDGVADKYLKDSSDVYSRAAVNLRMECKRIGIDPASL